MAPHPPLFPPAAFDRAGGLPPCEPSRFSSNPTFDLAFLKAAFDGDLRFVKRGARVVGRGAEGRRLAEMLGAVRDGYGNGLLHSAVLGGSLPVCRYLVEHLRMDVDDVGPFGGTPLTFAIGRRNVDLVRYFLDQGADVHRVNHSGTPPLHLAVGEEGSCEIVELLLSKGAYVDALNLGGTALHIAARHRRDDIMKVLLDHHADHKIALGGTGYTALFIATAMCSLKCVKLLLEAGADVDGACKETPLMIAATAGSTDILKCLVLAGADANIPNSIPSVRDWSVDGIITHVKSVRPVKKVMLASAKFRAHEAFKNGNYYAAAHIYREAIELDPGDATLLSNRSLCWLRYGDARLALKDAQALRMMRPGCPKACYRQGTALMLLKEYEKACGAFLDGLKLDPGNVEIEDGLREALESLKLYSSSPGED
ncbi:uncharacterized protein [Lolium perenne]|uniref:uncharacterized protein isoform X2 n=1 Tax=Lolium perenne TaxID=4522 RepID=UPI0021F4FEB4|nr:uncharacterized protein LOC127294473 isoform X2 [Lolium perenne]